MTKSNTKNPRTTGSRSSDERVPVIIDTREQHPYSFDASRVSSTRRGLSVGDYSIEGFEGSVAVERKSLDDYVASVITHRERFGRELSALAELDVRCVVVEAELEDIVHRRYRSGAHPSAVWGATLSIIVDQKVPVYFCGDRQLACRLVEGLLCRYHKQMTK